jgi:mono/diheme cytochrome c family protein
MKGKVLFIVLLGVLLLVISSLAFGLFSDPLLDGEPVVIMGTPAPPLPVLDAERITTGELLYAQYCASCHGYKLEGAPDWKTPLEDGAFPPPPQDSSGHTWHHSDTLLLDIIANGGDPSTNSRMPAFKDQLSTIEMVAILDFIKSSWGEEERQFQWWVTNTGN